MRRTMQSNNLKDSTCQLSSGTRPTASAPTSSAITLPAVTAAALGVKGSRPPCRRIALGARTGLQRERSATVRRSTEVTSTAIEAEAPAVDQSCKTSTKSIGLLEVASRRDVPAPRTSVDERFVVRDMIILSPGVVCEEVRTGATLLREISMGNRLATKTSSPKKSPPDEISQSSGNYKLGDIEIGDIDAADESISGIIVSPDSSHVWLTLPAGAPLDANTAADLKLLLFGNYKKDFPEEWKMQTFALNKNPELSYGIVQKKGGPCGVLACVQAYLLKELLFSKGRRTLAKSGFVDDDVNRCLALAFASILWKAGGHKMATVAFPCNRNSFTDERLGLCDGFVEKINLMKFTDLAALQSFLNRHVDWYSESGGHGACVAFLYSAVLSRTIENVKQDMDDANNCLIGAHGYCSQEVINLLLTGHASSNVFDNAVLLDEGTESQSTLKGVTRRSDFGFLALFEHYNSCQVGQYLKCPRYPIWVVCSESHYSVLFAKDFRAIGATSSADHTTNSQLEITPKFDVYLYDGLLQQEHEIRLTIDLTDERMPTKYYKDVVPPLELCIRTKWNGAVVNWNGTDPLL